MAWGVSAVGSQRHEERDHVPRHDMATRRMRLADAVHRRTQAVSRHTHVIHSRLDILGRGKYRDRSVPHTCDALTWHLSCSMVFEPGDACCVQHQVQNDQQGSYIQEVTPDANRGDTGGGGWGRGWSFQLERLVLRRWC